MRYPMISLAQIATATAPVAAGVSVRTAGAQRSLMLHTRSVSAPATALFPTLDLCPADVAERRVEAWHGLGVETVRVVRHETFECEFRAPFHVLLAYERGSRSAGETSVTGLAPSCLRDFSQRLSFVPAGYRFRDRHVPRTLLSAVVFKIDPGLLDGGAGSLSPRLFFENAALWQTTQKLKMLIGGTGAGDASYAEALGDVLVHEIALLNQSASVSASSARGTLSGWQRRVVADYIDEHLEAPISLAMLAGLARLSPFHFARAFKQSFGMPPHRYHTHRRVERAKTLLAQESASVTNVAIDVGFAETSSFTKAFRKLAGVTPTQYRCSSR
jgi:AraC family transcriptional regulator